jgi:DNA invertase Pin-like site-specific DNA recombinase
MLHVAAAFAEFEQQLISTRTTAGMRAKMATGWTPGREPVLQGEALDRARELRLAGASADQIVQAMQDEFEITVSRQTVYNWTSAPLEAKK